MWTFKFQLNSDPCNENVYTFHPGTCTFQRGIMIHCREESACVASGIDPDTQKALSQETRLFAFSRYFFAWINALAWNVAQIPGVFRGSVHVCKNRRGSVLYGNCYSCRDPPFFATFLNSFSQGITHMRADNTPCINLPSVPSKFRHSLHTRQKTYLAFYYFYLKTINPSFLLWRSQQDLLSLLVPSAAIKRCRVSECDQLLHRGPAIVLENIQSSQTSWEPPLGCCQPPGSDEMGDVVLATKVTSEQRGFQRSSSWPQVFGSN